MWDAILGLSFRTCLAVSTALKSARGSRLWWSLDLLTHGRSDPADRCHEKTAAVPSREVAGRADAFRLFIRGRKNIPPHLFRFPPSKPTRPTHQRHTRTQLTSLTLTHLVGVSSTVPCHTSPRTSPHDAQNNTHIHTAHLTTHFTTHLTTQTPYKA